MIVRRVERGEVIIIRLDFRPLEYLEPHARKDVDQLIFHQRDGVQGACRIFSPGHGDVDTLRLVFPFQLLFLHDLGAGLEFFLHALLKLVDDLSKGRTFLLGQLPHAAHDVLELRLKFKLQLV